MIAHVAQRAEEHLTRLAKTLRPENDLEWMTAVSEHACLEWLAKHDNDFLFTNVNTSIDTLSLQWQTLNLLEMDFVRKVDTHTPEAKQHLLENGLRFRDAEVEYINGLFYQKTGIWLWSIHHRYVKLEQLHIFIPTSYEYEFLGINLQSRNNNKDVNAFIAEIDALLAEDDDEVSPNDDDWIPKAAPTR